jgi:hypothetical protein
MSARAFAGNRVEAYRAGIIPRIFIVEKWLLSQWGIRRSRDRVVSD